MVSGTELKLSDPIAWHWPADTDWYERLETTMRRPAMKNLERWITARRAVTTVYPDPENVFAALQCTPLASIHFVILGQDPYHQPGQAHGLSFSVPQGTRIPPSLRNIFRELVDDTGVPAPAHGDLSAWARQGGLLLNAVLTVEAHQPLSHRGQGWEFFTDEIIRLVNAREQPVAFVLWGSHAQAHAPLIDESRHLIVRSAHPSPLSAHRGFFGSRPFSRINAWRERQGLDPIDWSLPGMNNRAEK